MGQIISNSSSTGLRQKDLVIAVNGRNLLKENHASAIQVFQKIEEGTTAQVIVERGM